MHDPLRHRNAQPLPVIPGYRLLRPLAEGGMSSVYLARQDALGRDVAIKLLRAEALVDMATAEVAWPVPQNIFWDAAFLFIADSVIAAV